MKIIKDQVNNTLLIIHDPNKVDRIETMLRTIDPGETLAVVFGGVNGTTPCVPRVFGPLYPHDNSGCMDFDLEYIELKVSIKETTKDEFVIHIENNTDEYIKPEVIVF